MDDLVQQVLDIVVGLRRARVPFALGGALALAYATDEPRGTRDLNVNVFVPPADAAPAMRALPSEVVWDGETLNVIARDGQARVWWNQTPVDLYFAEHAVHERAGGRIREVDFVGTQIPVLAPIDLAIFKVLFDRGRDWVDLEAMVDSRELDTAELASAVHDLLGDDSRVQRIRRLGQA